MAQVFVTNRVERYAGRWLLQKRGNLEDRCVQAATQSRSLMFTLVISNLPGICLAVHISPLRSVYSTGFKVTFIYFVLTCLCTICMDVERVDVIKPSIRSNKILNNNSAVNPSFLKLKMSHFKQHFLYFNGLFQSVPVILSPCSKNKRVKTWLFQILSERFVYTITRIQFSHHLQIQTYQIPTSWRQYFLIKEKPARDSLI